MMKIIASIVALAVAAIFLFAATKPDSFHIERSLLIKSPPEKVFPMINDFHNWESWSPWVNKDPNMEVNYSGANSGLGAVYQWVGNGEVGAGRMEIIDTAPPSNVKIKLDFDKPFEAHNVAEFTLVADSEHTKVGWITYGPMPYISKLFSVFVSLDELIGSDFEAGLANLKKVVEQ